MDEPRHCSWVRVRCAAAQLGVQLGREQLQQLAPVSLPLLRQLQRQARIARIYQFLQSQLLVNSPCSQTLLGRNTVKPINLECYKVIFSQKFGVCLHTRFE